MSWRLNVNNLAAVSYVHDLEQLNSREDIVQGMVQVIFHARNWSVAVVNPVDFLDCIVLSDTSDCMIEVNHIHRQAEYSRFLRP